MKIRQGRRNPHTLYVQVGDEPDHDRDISIGYVRFPALAAWMTERVNFSTAGYPLEPAALKELRKGVGEDETSSR